MAQQRRKRVRETVNFLGAAQRVRPRQVHLTMGTQITCVVRVFFVCEVNVYLCAAITHKFRRTLAMPAASYMCSYNILCELHV